MFVLEFAAAYAFFDHCVRNGIRLYAPAIVLAEVAGAVGRIKGDSAMGGVSNTRLRHFPKLYLRQVDLSLAEAAARAAARFSLRGADSHYVALARELKCPLITNDDEVIQRCAPTTKVLRPDKWLEFRRIVESLPRQWFVLVFKVPRFDLSEELPNRSR